MPKQFGNDRKDQIKQPPLWDVILISKNEGDFKVLALCLVNIFKKTEYEAYKIAEQIVIDGQAVVNKYSKDIAETKKQMVSDFIRLYSLSFFVEIKKS